VRLCFKSKSASLICQHHSTIDCRWAISQKAIRQSERGGEDNVDNWRHALCVRPRPRSLDVNLQDTIRSQPQLRKTVGINLPDVSYHLAPVDGDHSPLADNRGSINLVPRTVVVSRFHPSQCHTHTVSVMTYPIGQFAIGDRSIRLSRLVCTWSLKCGLKLVLCNV
jgi:hypothetical protein